MTSRMSVLRGLPPRCASDHRLDQLPFRIRKLPDTGPRGACRVRASLVDMPAPNVILLHMKGITSDSRLKNFQVRLLDDQAMREVFEDALWELGWELNHLGSNWRDTPRASPLIEWDTRMKGFVRVYTHAH